MSKLYEYSINWAWETIEWFTDEIFVQECIFTRWGQKIGRKKQKKIKIIKNSSVRTSFESWSVAKNSKKI